MKIGETWKRRKHRIDEDEDEGRTEWPDICKITGIVDNSPCDLRVHFKYPDWPNRSEDSMRRKTFIKEFEKVY